LRFPFFFARIGRIPLPPLLPPELPLPPPVLPHAGGVPSRPGGSWEAGRGGYSPRPVRLQPRRFILFCQVEMEMDSRRKNKSRVLPRRRLRHAFQDASLGLLGLVQGVHIAGGDMPLYRLPDYRAELVGMERVREVRWKLGCWHRMVIQFPGVRRCTARAVRVPASPLPLLLRLPVPRQPLRLGDLGTGHHPGCRSNRDRYRLPEPSIMIKSRCALSSSIRYGSSSTRCDSPSISLINFNAISVLLTIIMVASLLW
jgi:hypothetical protein